MVWTHFTLGLFSVLQKTVSFAVILQISVTQTLITFGVLVICSIVTAGIIVRWLPRLLIGIAFLIPFVTPFMAFGGSAPMLLGGIYLDFTMVFILIGSLILFQFHLRIRNVVTTLLVTFAVLGGYMALSQVFLSLGQILLAVPLGIVMILAQKPSINEPQIPLT